MQDTDQPGTAMPNMGGATQTLVEHPEDPADGATHARRAVDEMASLTTYVEQLAAKFPLCDHHSLRSQMRRAAGDALTHVACAVEAGQAADYRASLMRSRGALSELTMFARLGEKAGSLTATEASHMTVMIQMVDMELRCGMEESPFVSHTIVDATRAA